MPSGIYKHKSLSRETKIKIGLANSVALKGRKLSQEHIEKIRKNTIINNPMWKKEAREKVSQKLKGIKRAKGKESLCWKGDDITYFHFHKWLKDNFGKANKCENKNCNKNSRKFEWSLLKGKKYQRKRQNFWKLCMSCHRKYDYTDEQRKKLSIAHRGQIPWNKGIAKAEELKKEASKF